jgi:MFS family permease
LAGLGVVWGIGTILGPVVGGAFADSYATWRWAFYINLVIAAICVPIYVWALPSMDPQPEKKAIDKFKQMDWVGSVLNAGIYATYVIGITFGGGQWAWEDGRTIAIFVVCGILIIAFSLQQRCLLFTTMEQRIFPAVFLRSKTFLLQFFNASCMSAALFIPVYYIPVFFQFTRGDTALDAAVRLLPFLVVEIVATLANGALLPKVGYYMPWSLASGVLVTIGGSLLYTVSATTPASAVYGYSILVAVGIGLSVQACYSILTMKVVADPRFGTHMIPDAISFLNMAQIGAIVHCLAISGTVYQNIAFRYLSQALAGFGYTDSEIQSVITGTKSKVFLLASEEVKELAIGALVKAISQVYILLIVAGAFTLVSALLMKRERLFVSSSQ